MVRDQIECTVLHDEQGYTFEAALCYSNERRERRIEQKFYDDFASGGFDGPHYEIELFTDVSTCEHADMIHFHRTPANRLFVCWIFPIIDAESATALFRAWCAGTVYTIVTGKGCPALRGSDKKATDMFIRDLEQFGIVIKS